MTAEKPKPKQLLRPITTGAGSGMNQSQFLAITCNSLKAREESRVHGAIGFGFASHWLKNWRESFKPITKRSNRDHVITFDSHLKTALRCKQSVYMLQVQPQVIELVKNYHIVLTWFHDKANIYWPAFGLQKGKYAFLFFLYLIILPFKLRQHI